MRRADRDAFRLQVAKREAPRALLWTMWVFVAMTALNWAAGVSTPTDRVIDAAIIALAVACWALIRRPAVPRALTPWVFALFAATVAGGVMLQLWLRPAAPGFTYVLLVFAASGPLTLAWRPILAGAIPMLAGAVVVAQRWPEPDRTGWITVSIAAMALGLVLMELRLRGIDELGSSQAIARSLATTDRLTGTLNRHGVEEQVARFAGLATRSGQPLFVTFVDIDGLKSANDAHGHEFGDQVIRAVADALGACVRASDIVGRWGGDEFIIVGLGHAQDADELEHRVAARIAESGFDFRSSPGSVSVGTATSAPGSADFDGLIAAADADMYRRRQGRRAQPSTPG